MENKKENIDEKQAKAKKFRDAHKLELKPDFFAKKNSKPLEKIYTDEIEER